MTTTFFCIETGNFLSITQKFKCNGTVILHTVSC